MNEFEYCRLKFGSCSCASSGLCVCEKIIREVQDESNIEKARIEKEKKEAKKRERYIDSEPSFADVLRAAMLTPPRHLIEKYFMEDREFKLRLRHPPLFSREVYDWPKTERPEPIDSYADLDIRIYETISLKKEIVGAWITKRSKRKPLREIRAGIANLPKEKRKPHHVFLEDPVRKRKRKTL